MGATQIQAIEKEKDLEGILFFSPENIRYEADEWGLGTPEGQPNRLGKRIS